MGTKREDKPESLLVGQAEPQDDAANGLARAQRERVPGTSGDIVEVQIEKLRRVFPEVFVEGKIDFERLRAMLGAAAESGPNRFHFTWAGKNDAVGLLQSPSCGTLIPCVDESVEFDQTRNVFIEGENLEVLHVKVRCNVSSVGMHGHLGRYLREIHPLEIISIAPANRCR
jgi:hypothetical protein